MTFKKGHKINLGRKNPKVSERMKGNKFGEANKGRHPITEFKKGHIISEATKKKMSDSHKGKSNGRLGKHHSEETKIKMGISMINNAKINSNYGMTNKKHSKETKEKMCESRIGNKGPNWRGGITPLSRLLRTRSKWRIWRELIFLRDNFTCQNLNCKFCKNKIGILLHPHHIKPVALYPELVYKISNGITYCAGFHMSPGLHKNIQNKMEVIKWQK